MEGSLFSNGVLVDRTLLQRTETTKAEQILRMRLDATSRGVLTGGVVSANPLNTDRVDVGPFSGYVPRGDYIIAIGSNLNIALANYTLGVVNIVCAVYTENNTQSMPHETDGRIYPSRNEATYRMRVWTETDFNNPTVLPLSDNNLANDAKDRCLIISKVIAEGAGNPLVNFTNSAEYNNILYTNPSVLPNISGVTVVAVDPDCPVGNGSITFDDTAAPPYKFYWTSPGGVISAATNVSIDSIITITDGSGYWIKLEIIISQLPLGLVVPYTETVQVINLYYQEVPRFTGEDVLHRNKIGTGIISEHNPHGNDLDDFGGTNLSLLDEHQDVEHCNGIWKGSNGATFSGTISTASPSGDTVFIQAPPPGSLYYVNGKRLINANPTSIIFDAANFGSGYLGPTVKEGAKLYEIYVDDDEVIVPNLKAYYPNPRTVTGTWIMEMSTNHPVGTFDLEVNSDPGVDFVFSWAGGSAYRVIAPSVSSITGQVIRLFHLNGVDWIDLYIGDDVGATDRYLPTGVGIFTDTITVRASLSADQNLKIMSLVYWYDSVVPRGSIGYPPYGVLRSYVDNRSWGTLGTDQLADSFLNSLIYDTTSELNYSGLLLGRDSTGSFEFSSLGGLSIHLLGGNYYCKGKRLEYLGENILLPDNQTSILWLDYLGVLHIDDFSAAPFSSSLAIAIEWVCGYSKNLDVENQSVYEGVGMYTPERGVLLRIITTAGGAIIPASSYDISRGIGYLVDDWSVGSRITCVAAFDNFDSAFAYATFYSQMYGLGGIHGHIDLKIVGNVYIYRPVTQPVYVNVIGSQNADRAVYGAVSGDYTGIWILANGSKVSGVYCRTFAPCSLFRFKTNVIIENCNFSSTNGYFASLGTSADDVTIKECKIFTDNGIFSTPTGTFYRFNFYNNYVNSSSYNVSTALLIAKNLYESNIYKNTFYKDNDTLSPCIDVQNSGKFSLSNNNIYIDNSSSAAKEYGIYLKDCTNVSLVGNVVSRKTGSTSVNGVGICVNNSGSVVVSENVIGFMAVGIWIGADVGVDSGSFEEIVVSNNAIGWCFSCGIAAKADTDGTIANTITGLRIVNNYIGSLYKSAVADPVFSSTLQGIYVIVYNDALTSVKNIYIEDNVIDTLVNLQTTGNTYGIQTYVSTSISSPSVIYNISMSRNKLSNFTCTANHDVFGINLYTKNGLFPTHLGKVTNVDISDNDIYLYSYYNSPNIVRGINCFSEEGASTDNRYVSMVKIDNNSIIITPEHSGDVGDCIFIDNEYGYYDMSISNNTLAAPFTGIYGCCKRAVVSANTVHTLSVGMYFPVLLQSTVDGNTIYVEGYNSNTYYAIDTTHYGVFGILVNEYQDDFILSNNYIDVFSAEAFPLSALYQESANICLALGCCRFTISGIKTHQAYGSISGGGQAYHIYMSCPRDNWIVRDCHIDNSGQGIGTTTPSLSHGIYYVPVAVVLNLRGTIISNVIAGSNEAGDTRYELYCGNNLAGSITVLYNYVSLYNSAPTNGDVPKILLSANTYTNTTNTMDTWTPGPTYALASF